MNLLKVLASNMGMGDSVIFTILCAIIVFAVIAAIIFCVYYISNLMDKSEEKRNGQKEASKPAPVIQKTRNTNITDDDMMAAVLVATIDYRNEIKEDVRLVDVREIK